MLYFYFGEIAFRRFFTTKKIGFEFLKFWLISEQLLVAQDIIAKQATTIAVQAETIGKLKRTYFNDIKS